ncbi:MAG: single-stranded DNA-binding protein [Mycobacterium sp.]
MFETPITVVGRIITDLRRRVVAGQEVISFRVASNSRRRTAEGTWEPGNTLYITVNCWGKLVTGVGAGLYKGAAIIAVGTVHTSEYEDRDGVKRSSLEMRASAVGPDLAWTIARIEQPPQPRGAAETAEAGGTDGDPDGDSDGEPGSEADPGTDSDSAALSLSA